MRGAAATIVGAAAALLLLAQGLVAADSVEQETLSTLGDPNKFYYAARHALYRLPQGEAQGTCVFVHGCKHDPEGWFYRSRSCPQCLGLPEEVAHSKACLARGYAVLALASRDRRYRRRCFSSSSDLWRNDQPEALQAINDWTLKYGLADKRIYVWGISSGAAFTIKLPHKDLRLDGLVSEVNMPEEKNWGMTDGMGTLEDASIWPPVAYFWMKNDAQTQRQVEKAIEIFDNNGVPAQPIYSPPWQVTPTFFSDRSMYFTPAQSAAVVAALQKIKVLYNNGYIIQDPRFFRRWTQQLPKLLPWLRRDSPYFNIISDESQIWQSLNMAYSQHEIVAEYVHPTLMWLDSNGTSDLNGLSAAAVLPGDLRGGWPWHAQSHLALVAGILKSHRTGPAGSRLLVRLPSSRLSGCHLCTRRLAHEYAGTLVHKTTRV